MVTRIVVTTALLASTALLAMPIQPAETESDLDRRVKAFLDRARGSWRDMNVPEADGQTLYNIVTKNKYTRALEIGTSTGHSGIWIAWALS